MTAADLLADCRRRGVDVTAVGDRLRWRCRGGPPADLLNRLRERKAEILATLTAAACPACRGPTDAGRRCWRCCDRPCVGCGRPTGSAFIQRCSACGARFNGNRGGWADDGGVHP